MGSLGSRSMGFNSLRCYTAHIANQLSFWYCAILVVSNVHPELRVSSSCSVQWSMQTRRDQSLQLCAGHTRV